MARGGLPDFPSTGTPLPGVIAGQDLARATQAGLGGFYTAREQGRRERQEEREGAKFEMASQLHPLALKGAELGVQKGQLEVDLALDAAARSKAERGVMGELMTRMKGAAMKPEEIQLGFVNAALAGGRWEHAAQALKDYRTLLEPTEVAAEGQGMYGDPAIQKQWAKAAETNNPGDWMGMIPLAMKYPRAAMKFPLVTMASNRFEASLKDQVPTEVGAFLTSVRNDLMVADPKTPKHVLWDAKIATASPAVVAWLQKPEHAAYVPTFITESRGVAKAGAEEAAKETARQPGRVALEEVKGKEARATEKVKGEEARKTKETTLQARTEREAIALVTTSQREVAVLETKLKDPMVLGDPEEAERVQDRLTEARFNLRRYQEQVQTFVGRRGEKGKAEPGAKGEEPEKPKRTGLDPSVLSRARAEIRGEARIKTREQLEQVLQSNVQKGALTKEEADRLRESEGKRYPAGAKK